MLFPSSSNRWIPLRNLPNFGHFPVPSGGCFTFCPESIVVSAVGFIRWELSQPFPEAEPPYNFVLSRSEERENLVYACRILGFEISVFPIKNLSFIGESFSQHV